jgi:hypothetical protein
MVSLVPGPVPEDLKAAALARMRGDPFGYVPPIWVDGKGLREKVCIVGFAGSTRDDFPKNDPTMELWGMNRLHEVPTVPVGQFHRWFQIHPRAWWDIEARGKEVAWMRGCSMPLYLQEALPDFPTSIPFPRAAIEAAFNKYLPALPGTNQIRNDGEPYVTNTPVWMIALALLEGFKEIHIYGVDMVTDEEYGYQRPCCDYWIGLCGGLGVKVVIPPDSALCTQEWLYGYHERPVDKGPLTREILLSRQKGITMDQKQAEARANFHAGQLAELNSLLAIQKHAGRGGKTGIKASLAMGQPLGPPVKG